MAKMLVCYFSRTKHTQHMAEAVAKGAAGVEGIQVELKNLSQVNPKDLANYDAIIMGSPTYYGSMCGEMKKFLDESVALHGRLDGKVGAAFSSSAIPGGGSETTILDILKAMLIHGMIIKGETRGYHYGPIAVGDPNQPALDECVRLGKNTAALTMKLD